MAKGRYPPNGLKGATRRKRGFQASYSGKSLGTFDTEAEAHAAYLVEAQRRSANQYVGGAMVPARTTLDPETFREVSDYARASKVSFAAALRLLIEFGLEEVKAHAQN